MGSTKEKAEKTKHQLLAAALLVFSKKGFNRTRLEDISQKAGVTRGAFYWHFKNKTEIFCEVHRQIMHDLFQTMQKSVSNSLTPITNLKNILYTIISKVLNDHNSRRRGRLFYSSENDPNVAKAINQLKREIEPIIRAFFFELINNGKKINEIRDDIETDLIFKSSIVTLNGTIIQIFNGVHSFNEQDINSLLEIFIDGIKRQK